MEGHISYFLPQPSYWEAYGQLWKNSIYQPVFQSPQYIQYLCGLHRKKIASFSCYRDGELRGAAFFWKNGDSFQFLSDIRNDHNFFLIHRSCSPEEIEAFFESFLRCVKAEKWSLKLNSQPTWASYMPAFRKAGRETSLFWKAAYLAPCPMLDGGTPAGVFRRFNRSKNIRYKQNRLVRELGASFEIFTDAAGLDSWVDEFCEVHIRRWQNTWTPSLFEDSERERRFFKGCLDAWDRDGLLVRFSIKVNDVRIAFCVALVQENSLLYHTLTFDPEYSLYSPGKVLLLCIGHWMKNTSLNILDFGYGDEDYKFRYANYSPALESIYISPRWNIPFRLRAEIVKLVRENPVLIKNYRKRVKPLMRKLAKMINRLMTWKLINIINFLPNLLSTSEQSATIIEIVPV